MPAPPSKFGALLAKPAPAPEVTVDLDLEEDMGLEDADDEEYRACAIDVMDAVKSGDVDALTTALKTLMNKGSYEDDDEEEMV